MDFSSSHYLSLTGSARPLVTGEMLKVGSPFIGEWSTRPFYEKEKDSPRVLTCPFPEIQIPVMTFSQMVFQYLEKYKQRIFLVEEETGEEYTYGRVLNETRRLAGTLQRLKVELGDIVCMFSTNKAQYVISMYAITALGAAVTYANPLGTEGELTSQVEQTKSIYIVADDQNYHLAKQVSEKFTHVKGVIVLGCEDVEGCLTYHQLLSDPRDSLEAPVPMDPVKTALHIPFSSGTTGLPKGVVISHKNTVAAVCLMSTPYFSLVESEDVTLLVLPLYHLYATLVVQFAMASGSKVVLLRKFKPATFLGALQKYQATFIPLVPPLALFFLESPLVSEYNTSSWQSAFTAAAPLALPVAQKLKTKFQLKRLMQGYGMTETGFTIVTPRFNQELDTVGVALHNTKLKVVDTDTGDMLSPFMRGEICVRTPQMTLGYLNNISATTNLIDEDGWAHTGDVGYYDESGRFYFLERVKEIFKNKGHQVAPAELESLLLTHPDVIDAAVVGTPDIRAGAVPRAFLVLRPGAQCTTQDIQDFIAGLSSPEKHLKGGVFFVESIPKNPTGKIQRSILRKLGV